MLQAFRQFFSDLAGGGKDHTHFEENDYRLAAAALLIHSALIDGAMSDAERDKLQGMLMLRFGLDDMAAHDLMNAAIEAEQQAVDLYHFTSLLNRTLDDAGRQQIIEMMWQVAHADGQVTEFEDNLIWRAADLLYVPAQARIELRRRVAASLGLGHD